MENRIHLLILAFFLIFNGLQSWGKSCRGFYSNDPLYFLPSQQDLPLPPEILSVIEGYIVEAQKMNIEIRHRAPRGSDYDDVYVRKPIGKGEGFVFGVGTLRDNFMNLGEHVGAVYVAKILHALFPLAKIENGEYGDFNLPNFEGQIHAHKSWSRKNPGKHLVFFGIHDSEEQLRRRERNIIEMTDIKPANPGFGAIAPRSLRPLMGIPSDHFAINLYFKYGDGNPISQETSPSFSTAIARLKQTLEQQHRRPPDIIFLSNGGGRGSFSELHLASTFPEYGVIRLSRWKKDYSPNKKWIVLNDLRGYMPHLLNLSNLAIVSGPINIIEPLTSMVPLIFFNSPESIVEYSHEAFNQMAKLATKTGGGFEIKSVNDFFWAVGKALDKNLKITPPYLVSTTTEGINPVEKLVQSVLTSVHQGLRHSYEVSELVKDFDEN